MKTGEKSKINRLIEQGLKDIQNGDIINMNPTEGKMTREQIAQSLSI